jgi:hypothetical protein
MEYYIGTRRLTAAAWQARLIWNLP